MRFAKALMAIAASSLAIAPAMANPASSLSVGSAKSVRAATGAGKSSEVAGGFLIPAIAIVAVITGVILVATDDDKSDSP